MIKYIFRTIKSVRHHLSEGLLSPYPLRIYFLQNIVRKLNIGSFLFRLEIDAILYPGYAYCMYCAALQAKSLGISKITAIEFGVATGNGLLMLETHAKDIEKELGIQFEIYGFDTALGLPKPVDIKDQGYFWIESSYRMDVSRLQKKLSFAKLIIGNVDETVVKLMSVDKLAPIGFVAFDLDYFTSTCDALSIFNSDEKLYLPRVEAYIDDVCSSELLYASKGTGALAAVDWYNNMNEDIKLYKKEGVSSFRRYPKYWNEKVYALHRFKHPLYSSPVVQSQESTPV